MMPDVADLQHPITLPEKPALEGLEAKWNARWEEDRHLPVRPDSPARGGVLDRHAAADGQRFAARRARVLVHAHRPHRALPADARQGRVLSDGVGRQRPADRAPRAELLRRPVRSVAAVRPVVPAAVAPGKRGARQAADLGVAAEFHRALRAADRRGREGVRASVAVPRPVGRLVDDLRDDRPARAARVAGLVPAPACSAASPTSSRRRRCGTSTSGPPSRRRSSRIASSPARITASAFASPIVWTGYVEIDTTRPELIPACVALVAHPDDERYQPLFGTRGDDAALRRRVPVQAARARRSRKGQRHRDDLHVRRHHRRDVVARARAAGPRGHRSRTARFGRSRWGAPGWESRRPRARAAGLRPAGGSVRGEGTRANRRAAARVRRSDRRAAADHARGEVLREGRSPARDRHEPPVVHQDDGVPRGAARRAAASCSGIRRTCGTASRTGSTA